MIERYSRPKMKQVWSDVSKFSKWLEIEIAVCEAWSEMGVVPRKALPKIKLARVNLTRMEEILKETHHDMTAFLGSLSENLGEEARYVHLGITSSDVMDTALSLQMIEAADILMEDVKELTAAVAEKAIKYRYTPMIGRTHGIHAEPISFGLKLALWVEELNRNRHRLLEAKKAVAAGKISGAVGTFATVPPEIEEKVCARLKLTPAAVSSQILQRDRHAQFVTTLAIVAGSLEKFATEVRHLQRTEVREVEEPFGEKQTGSSAMPHKRNPELCERITGLARVVRGYALTSMENIALWHERDISHSSTERVIIPGACLLLDYTLAMFCSIVKGLVVHTDRMKQNLRMTRGLFFSQRIMLAMIDKGMSRTKAYELVQRNAMKAAKGRRDFLKLLKADPDVAAVIPADELELLFDEQWYLRHIDDIFKRAGLTGTQWKEKAAAVETIDLAPRSL